jgi:hypothetical protein
MDNNAYKTRDITQYTNSLARYLPNDELFNGKNSSSTNVRKFLKGLSYTLLDTNGYLKEFTEDYTPDVTQKFITEWETVVGIPDDCFLNTLSLTKRRLQVIAKLSYMSVQTAEDFVDLAGLLGYGVTVVPGMEDITGITAGLTDTEKRFTIVVNTFLAGAPVFPYTFPIIFPPPAVNYVECLFQNIDPSNCQLLFNNIP